MLGRRRLMALCLAVSLLFLVALYGYAWSINPRDMRICEIGHDDIGALVRTRGHAKSVETLGSGGVKVELLDYSDFARISVFVPGKVVREMQSIPEVVPGAELMVTGEVQEFNGEVEISVSDASRVEIIAPAAENRLQLGMLALNPETFGGMHVVARGEVDGLSTIMDWSKLLVSSGGDTFWVEDRGGRNPGGRIDVFGKLLYDEGRGRFEIKVAGGTDGIMPHPSKAPGNYTVVTLGDLAENPESLEGGYLAVLDVVGMAGEIIGTSFSLSDSLDGEKYEVACITFGWDWSNDNRRIEEKAVVEFSGTWGYYSSRAQWQITSDEFTLSLLP